MTFILETKLLIPQIPQKAVFRSKIINQLNSSNSKKLIVISAPAGYGKTTLVTQWIQKTEYPVAWFSIDKNDNDVVRFFTYFISAVQKAGIDIGYESQKLLQSQLRRPDLETILGHFINCILSENKEILIVIDDYHLIHSHEIHEGLSYFIEYMPPQVKLVIATRSDPPIKLSRLRGLNQLLEFRAKDLGFNTDEASAFFNKIMSLDLSEIDINKLNLRIEGWIAGLQMAGLSLQGREDITSFIDSLSGSSRYIMDYLLEEVYSVQPESVKTFLIKTSILERMNRTICNAVTENENGQEILESLEQANLFLIPLDDERNWYRYHHLFAELLQKRFQQLYPQEIHALHQKASAGFEQLGLMNEAIQHLLKAQQFEKAESLMGQIAEQMWKRGEQGTLLHWARILNKNITISDPDLCLYLAVCFGLDGQFDKADSYLFLIEESDRNLDNVKRGMIAAVRTYVENYRGNALFAEENAQLALSLLDDDHAIWRCLASMAMGDIHAQKGPLIPATNSYKEAIRSGLIAGNTYCVSLAQHRLVVMYQRQGLLNKAFDLVKDYLNNGNQQIQSGALNLIYGELLYERNCLDQAEYQIEESLKICKYQHHAAAIPYCLIQLARILLAKNEIRQAKIKTDESVKSLDEADIPPWVKSFVIAWQIRFALLFHDFNLAEKIINERDFQKDGKFGYPRELEYLFYARYLFFKERFDALIPLLNRLYNWLQSINWLNLAYEVQLLKTQVFFTLGQKSDALSLFEQITVTAQKEGYLRLFIDEGKSLQPVLEYVLHENGQSQYIEKILHHIKGQDDAGIIPDKSELLSIPDPLSDRELQVLRLLKTHLASTEIANELFISTNTIKTHIKNIYAKLNVHNRNEAVQKAKELSLI